MNFKTKNIKILMLGVGLNFLSVIIFGIPQIIISTFSNYSNDISDLAITNDIDILLQKFEPSIVLLLSFIILCVISPIFEEFIFRYWLSGKNKILLTFSLILFLFVLLSFNSLTMPYFVWLVINPITIFLLLKFTNFQTWLQKTPLQNILLSSLAFMVVHSANIGNSILNLSFSVYAIAMLNYLFAGLVFGIIRIKLGIKWSILTHSIRNFIAFLFVVDILKNTYITIICATVGVLFILYSFYCVFYCTLKEKLLYFGFLNISKKLTKTITVGIILLIAIFGNILHSQYVFLYKESARKKEYSLLGDIESFWFQSFFDSIKNPAVIAIIDTPIFDKHKEMEGKIFKKDCLIVDCENCENNRCDHATEIAGIIGYVSPSTKIWAIQSIDSDLGSSEIQYNQALQLVLDYIKSANRIDVVNISWNTSDLFEGNCDNFKPKTTELMGQIVKLGTKIVVSTGNDGNFDKKAFPSCISTVYSVGSVSNLNDGKVSTFSNGGNNVNFLSVGELLSVPKYDKKRFDKMTKNYGTSISTAIVSAIVSNRLLTDKPISTKDKLLQFN